VFSFVPSFHAGGALFRLLGFMDTPTQIQALIAAELSQINDSRLLSHIRSLLVDPVAILRDWDYGVADESYLCWAVLDHSSSNTGIAYCAQGFGPNYPWGLVFLSGQSNMSIGMDSGWYESFMSAYMESMAVSELPIWRAYKQDDCEYPGVALTEESSWDSTWEEVYRLRKLDPDGRYHCSQSIFRRDE
jgi:hypothetical protein